MPRKEIDYSKSCIYQIVCKDPTILDSYIGSTTNLPTRHYHHDIACNNPKASSHNSPVYRFIRGHGGFDNFTVVWLEDCPCSSHDVLLRKERELLELLKPTLNKNLPIAFDTDAEANKEQLNEKRRKYYAANKEKIRGYAAKFAAANKEKMRAYSAKYEAANKEKIRESAAARACKKVECPCGSIISRSSMYSHTKTNKHQAYLESKK